MARQVIVVPYAQRKQVQLHYAIGVHTQSCSHKLWICQHLVPPLDNRSPHHPMCLSPPNHGGGRLTHSGDSVHSPNNPSNTI